MSDRQPGSLQILLVEDEEDVRATLKLILDLDHHTVVEAADGAQGLQRFADNSFDLVITDYVMPEVQGDELARTLKKQHPGIPVIMITANADLLPRKLPEVDFLLSKPFQIAELRTAIQKVTGVGTPT